MLIAEVIFLLEHRHTITDAVDHHTHVSAWDNNSENYLLPGLICDLQNGKLKWWGSASDKLMQWTRMTWCPRLLPTTSPTSGSIVSFNLHMQNNTLSCLSDLPGQVTWYRSACILPMRYCNIWANKTITQFSSYNPMTINLTTLEHISSLKEYILKQVSAQQILHWLLDQWARYHIQCDVSTMVEQFSGHTQVATMCCLHSNTFSVTHLISSY